MPPISDWRSPVVANELYQLEHPVFAWEFHKRNHGYRKTYASLRRRSSADGSDEVASDAKLARWGLSFRVRPSSVRSSGKSRMAPEPIPTAIALAPAPKPFRSAVRKSAMRLGTALDDRTCADGQHVVLADPAGELAYVVQPLVTSTTRRRYPAGQGFRVSGCGRPTLSAMA